MRFTPLATVLVCIGTALAACSSYRGQEDQQMDAQPAAELKAIEELHQLDIAATKAYDVEALVSLWTDDIVLLPPGQPPVIGKEACRPMLEANREQSRNLEVFEYNQTWEEIQVVGDYAFEWGTIKSAVRPKAGGDMIGEHYKVFRILKRQPDGSWKFHRAIWNDAPRAAESAP